MIKNHNFQEAYPKLELDDKLQLNEGTDDMDKDLNYFIFLKLEALNVVLQNTIHINRRL